MLINIFSLEADQVTNWDKLTLGMSMQNVKKLLGDPSATMCLKSVTTTSSTPELTTKEFRKSTNQALGVGTTIWTYNKPGEQIVTRDGKLEGKTLRFDKKGVLIEIAKIPPLDTRGARKAKDEPSTQGQAPSAP